MECSLHGVQPLDGVAFAGDPALRAEWVRLLHGADELEQRRLRPSTQLVYSRGVADFATFCREWGVPALPATPEALRAYIYYCTTYRNLDAHTVEGRMSALGDWHSRQSRALVRAGRAVLGNPCSAPPVADLLAVVRRVGKTGHRGRLPLTRPEFVRMLLHGFDLSRASGHHHRLCLVISTLGCLRRRAAVHLRVKYSISGSLVSFSSDSDVYIAYNEEAGMEYIGLRVNVDKNVDSSVEALAYIPASVPGLSVQPVELLRDYLVRFRPPSGSYLLSAPRTHALQPAQFNGYIYTGLNRTFRAAYLHAYPDATQRTSDITRVSSHSGRKSLSQWLWDAY